MPLFARSQGAGPPLVLLHGLFGTLENLGGIAKPLAQHFTVISLDLPNHGRSQPLATLSLPLMAQQVATWLAGQGIQQAHFLGHSLGGKVLMELALQQPNLVEKLVVLDIAPVHYSPHHNAVFEGLLALQPSQLTSRAEADAQLAPYVPETAIRSFLLKNLVKTEQGFAWRMDLPIIHRDYAAIIGANSPAAFTGPTLFIKGGDSPYIQAQHQDAILQRFPHAQVKVVPNTGHWLHAEKPEVVAGVCRRFLLA